MMIKIPVLISGARCRKITQLKDSELKQKLLASDSRSLALSIPGGKGEAPGVNSQRLEFRIIWDMHLYRHRVADPFFS